MFVDKQKTQKQKIVMIDQLIFLQSSKPKFKLVIDKDEIKAEIINDEGEMKNKFDELRARVAIAEKNKACCEKAKKV